MNEQRLSRTKRTHSQRGRSVVAWSLASFLAAQLALSLAMDVWEPALRDPLWGRKLSLLRERMAEDPDRPLVVILGSSRSALGVRLSDVPRDEIGEAGPPPLVFNLGIMGAGPVHELMFLHRLLQAGIRPDRVLIEIHPLLMHEDPGFGEVAVLNVKRLDRRDLKVLERYVYTPSKMYRNWFRSRLVPCVSHRVLLQMHFAPAWLEPVYRHDYDVIRQLDPTGWAPHFRERLSLLEHQQCLELSIKSYEPAFVQFRVTDMPDRAVREMLEICRREQIDAGLFLMPESSEFRDAYTADARDRIDEYLITLNEEYGAPIFDATFDCADEDFADGHHLLPHGAAHFAARFQQEVLQPFLARSGPSQTSRADARTELAERPALRGDSLLQQR